LGDVPARILRRRQEILRFFYKEGLIKFNKRDYGDALKKFEELKASFPDSPAFHGLG